MVRWCLHSASATSATSGDNDNTVLCCKQDRNKKMILIKNWNKCLAFILLLGWVGKEFDIFEWGMWKQEITDFEGPQKHTAHCVREANPLFLLKRNKMTVITDPTLSRLGFFVYISHTVVHILICSPWRCLVSEQKQTPNCTMYKLELKQRERKVYFYHSHCLTTEWRPCSISYVA